MAGSAGAGGDEDGTDREIHVIQMITDMFSTMDSNDLASLKTYLDSGDSKIENYINAIEYSYNVSPQIYKQNGDDIRQVHPDTSFEALGLGSSTSSSSMMSSMMSTNVFFEMPKNEDLYKDQYDVQAGRWPKNHNECVVVLTSSGGISDFMLYTLGLRDPLELDEMIQQFIDEEDVEVPKDMGDYSYEDLLGITFKQVNSSDYYQYDNEYGLWRDKRENDKYMKELVENGEDLKIVGVVQPAEDANGALLSTGIVYPAELTEYVAKEAAGSEIVKEQLENRSLNVFTGKAFGEESEENEFDMDSLVTVDEEALREAFGMDGGLALEDLTGSVDLSELFDTNGSTIDLGGMMDFNDMQIDLPAMEGLNLEEVLGNIELSVSAENFGEIFDGLLAGYQEYATENPQADYSHLGENFLEYLRSDGAKEILKEHILGIIQENGDIIVSTDQFEQLFREILTGFLAYVQENNYTDVSQLETYLMEYLQTEEARQILENWVSEILDSSSDLEVAPEQLEGLAMALASGYQEYAVVNGLPDPGRMGEHFLDYLGTEKAQLQLMQGLMGAVDTEGLRQQLSSAFEGYFKEMMSTYSETLSAGMESQISSVVEQLMSQIMEQISTRMETAMQQAMSQIGDSLEDSMNIDAEAFSDAFSMNMTGEELVELMMSMSSTANATFEGNLQSLGYVDFDEPSEISIYPKNFESKEEVIKVLDSYNQRMEDEGREDQVITYTDVVGTLMSSVTDIIDIISYVLIAFVAISLIVSSIMIGVITYISVLERKKEIGILRAIGASKGNVSEVFNAETVIIGLCAGLIGIGLTLFLLIPGNMLIHHLADTDNINAVLPVQYAVVLVLLSVLLTLLGGLIPSKKAAKSDPVTALRTE